MFLDHRRQFFARGTSIVALTHRGGVPCKTFEKFDDGKDRVNVSKLNLEEFSVVLSGK